MRVESPAKLNLSLMVNPPRSDGYHPLESLVQTIDWCDTLGLDGAEDGRDEMTIFGIDLDPEDNLVVRSLAALRTVVEVPPLSVRLEKTIPMEAGLGGGSSNAAATLLGASQGRPVDRETLEVLALGLGSDVPLFLTGGTLQISGVGEIIEPLEPLAGFALAVVVPDFGLVTADVYRQWDLMEGPEGETLADDHVPPPLRDGMPLRNDLLPAALALEPEFGDFMADLRSVWGTPVSMTGSGSACFGYFPTVDEAADAAHAVAHLCREVRGVALRERGVEVVS